MNSGVRGCACRAVEGLEGADSIEKRLKKSCSIGF